MVCWGVVIYCTGKLDTLRQPGMRISHIWGGADFTCRYFAFSDTHSQCFVVSAHYTSSVSYLSILNITDGMWQNSCHDILNQARPVHRHNFSWSTHTNHVYIMTHFIFTNQDVSKSCYLIDISLQAGYSILIQYL